MGASRPPYRADHSRPTTRIREGVVMPKQALTHARRIKHKGLRTGLTVAVAGAAIALPATAAVAMPTDYTKEVKVDNGDTLKLDGFGKKVSISDPEHGVTGSLS